MEYRVTMDRLTSAFHEEVQVRGVNAYSKLIHDLKITVCKYNSDLSEADEQAVLKSIKRHDGQHFKQGFVVKVRATSSREHHPDFLAAQYNTEVHSAICKLHLDAADTSHKMAHIYYNLALIKTKVSPSYFIKISTSIPLPLTTVEIVDPAKPSTVDIDSLRIHDHMPDPSKLSGHKPTKLLAALVSFHMQNILCKMQGAYPMLKCKEDFGLGRTALKESFQASREHVDMSTKDSEQWVLMRNQLGGPDRKGRGRTPWTKNQQVWYLVRSTSVSFVKRCVHRNPV